MEPNPPWVDRVLNKHFDALVDKVGIDMMPHPDALTVGKTKQRYGSAELGCGHYGCVFETAAPGWVFKITSDPTEAQFITSAMSLPPGDMPEGIVRYKGVWSLGEWYKNRPVYALVREEAEYVGGLTTEVSIYRSRNDQEDRQTALKAKSVLAHLSWFKEWAALARKKIQVATDMSRMLAAVKSHEEWAFDKVDWSRIVELIPKEYRPTSSIPPYIKGPQAAAYAIRAARIVAEDMENEDVGYLVGGALGYYLDQGILLADVHGNNVGQVEREDYTKPIWVITDPGHAVALEERWLDVRVPEL